jgi:leucyl-tRNA synthetase
VGISTGGIVISEGQKMAKSKGNVIPLLTVKRKYGADLFRLYLASNADVWYDVDWRSNEAENYTKKMERFFELASEASKVIGEPDERDLWLIARFNRRLARARQSFESMKIRDASVELFFNMLNDVRDLENFAGTERMLRVVKKFADKWALSLSPIIPYISEEIHSIYGGNEFASLQKYPDPDNSFESYEKEWLFIESIIEDYRNILKISQDTHSKLIINTAEDWKWELLERYKNEGKRIIKDIDGEKRDFVLQLIKKGDIKTGIRNEADVLEIYKEDLKKLLNIDIEINGEIPQGRMKKAYPGKPSLTLS